VAPARGDGPDPQVMAASLHAELLQRSVMVASAESITGGALGDLLSAAPGASETYLGGVVSYATDVKLKLLGVAERTVREHGVVSAECAAEMASGVRSLLGADYGVSTTGVAGPTQQEGKPVGLVYIGVAGPEGVRTLELNLSGDRRQIRRQTCVEAVSALLTAVVGAGG
jgi:nicotinamide-nucleotide amidase